MLNLEFVAYDFQVLNNLNKLWPCHSCESVFEYSSQRVLHILEEHSNQKETKSQGKSYRCIKCQAVFSTLPTLRDHLQKHEFRCALCLKTFLSKALLKKHLKRVHSSEQKINTEFNCDFCGDKFKKSRPRDRHVFYNHSTNPTSFHMCEKCGKYFFDKQDLLDHFKSVHEKCTKFVCEECGYVCDRKGTLDGHIRQKHRQEGTEITCEQCGKTVLKKRIKRHNERYHQDESLRKCQECFVVFANAAELYKHYQANHQVENCPVQVDGYRVFECHLCKKILASSAAHYTHLKLTHKTRISAVDLSIATQGKQTCSTCRQTFDSIKDLIKHFVQDHKDIDCEVPRSNHRFRCDDCDVIYSGNHYYKHLKFNHVKIPALPRCHRVYLKGI